MRFGGLQEELLLCFVNVLVAEGHFNGPAVICSHGCCHRQIIEVQLPSLHIAKSSKSVPIG